MTVAADRGQLVRAYRFALREFVCDYGMGTPHLHADEPSYRTSQRSMSPINIRAA